MKPFTTVTDDAVAIGAAYPLTNQQVATLGDLFHHPPGPGSSVLGGRCAVRFTHLEPIGHVVVKYYTRGGAIRHVVKRRYIRWGPTRSQKEFDLLQTVRRLGVNAPEPIAYAHQGRMCYQAWLVTRAVDRHQTLAQIGCTDEAGARRLIPAICTQVKKLIDHGILHVDLHPGNILVDSEGQVYLIDFDKARLHMDRRGLRKKYLQRWRRAVQKHDLPPALYRDMDDVFRQVG